MESEISHKPLTKAEIIRKDLKDMVENLPLMLEFNAIQAQLMKSKYDELKKAGFSEKQAMVLCR